MYLGTVRLNDDCTERSLSLQVLDANSRHQGGIVSPLTGVARPSHTGTAADIEGMVAAYLNPDSRFFRAEVLRERLGMALDFMLDQQHADGTISLGSTNFNSPPDTGFVVSTFGQIFEVLQAQPNEIPEVRERVQTFLLKTVPAMLTGGVHTPNHRWVMTAALAWLYHIFGDPNLVLRAQQWLAEGVDCTADGEWTERSNGIYNAVADLAFYHIARWFEEPDWLLPVRRNLRAMAYLVHPDGMVVTEYSGRQDVGRAHHLAVYELIFRLMAEQDRDPLFAAMAELAAESSARSATEVRHMALGYLLYPELRMGSVPPAPLPDEYNILLNAMPSIPLPVSEIQAIEARRLVPHSALHTAFGAPVARWRQGRADATVMARCPLFMSLRHGRVALLGVKLSSSFLPGPVSMDGLVRTDSGYRLAARMHKGYFGPLPVAAAGQREPWCLMPHEEREVTHLQEHAVGVEVVRAEPGWEIVIDSDPRPDVYMQVAFWFAKDVDLFGEGIEPIGPDAFFWKSGTLVASVGDDRLEMTGGSHEHWLETLPHDAPGEGIRTVLVNLLTPVRHRIAMAER